MATSVGDLCVFHTMERNLFIRLVRNMGAQAEVTKQIIALWLWMEFIGYPELIRHIICYEDSDLMRIVAEGEACLEALRPDTQPPTGDNDIPMTANLAKEPINLRFFRYNREAVIRGITYMLNKVCNIIFDENVLRAVTGDAGYLMNQATTPVQFVRAVKEGTSWPGARLALGAPLAMATPYESRPFDNEPEDQRSMFLTFSRGYPLSKEDVVEFFTLGWGNCIDKVTIERPLSGGEPLFGTVVFNSSSVIPLILNGNDKAKFVVKGRHLWARVFVPRRDGWMPQI